MAARPARRSRRPPVGARRVPRHPDRAPAARRRAGRPLRTTSRVHDRSRSAFATASALCGAGADDRARSSRPGRLQGAGAALLVPGSSPCSPRRSARMTDRARSARGRGSRASPARRGPSSADGSSTQRRGDGRSSSTCRSRHLVLVAARHVPESVDPDAPRHLDVLGATVGRTRPGIADCRAHRGRAANGRRRPSSPSSPASSSSVAFVAHRATAVRPDAPPRPVPIEAVHRGEPRHARGLRRARRRVLLRRREPAGVARLLGARSRGRPDSRHRGHAPALGADGCALPKDRPPASR